MLRYRRREFHLINLNYKEWIQRAFHAEMLVTEGIEPPEVKEVRVWKQF